MSIWTDLQTAIETKIAELGYTGTLPELGIGQPYEANLLSLLSLQAQLYSITATGGGGGGGGDASSANQTAVQAIAGNDASKAIAVQGITGGKAVPVVLSTTVVTSTQLTGTGSTTAIATAGYKLVGVTAKVASIGTNVVVRVEVSNVGGTNAADWDNAALDNTDTTITANGTKAFKLDCAFAYVRFTWVSTSGGSPTIDVITRLAS